MNDETARAHQELATRNSKVAVDDVRKTRDELLSRMNHLEHLVATQEQRLAQVEQKYNLLLTARFDGRSTT